MQSGPQTLTLTGRGERMRASGPNVVLGCAVTGTQYTRFQESGKVGVEEREHRSKLGLKVVRTLPGLNRKRQLFLDGVRESLGLDAEVLWYHVMDHLVAQGIECSD